MKEKKSFFFQLILVDNTKVQLETGFHLNLLSGQFTYIGTFAKKNISCTYFRGEFLKMHLSFPFKTANYSMLATIVSIFNFSDKNLAFDGILYWKQRRREEVEQTN